MNSRSVRARLLRRLAIVLLILLPVLWFTSSVWLPVFGQVLVRHDSPPKRAEVAVVLAGDGWGNRVLRAGELLREGLVPKLLVSGPPGMYGFFESDLAVKFGVERGLPAGALEALHLECHSTQEEAHVIVEELKRRGIRRIMVVTSDYHTRRAGRIWRYIAPWMEIQMIAAPDRYFRKDAWWRDREGAKQVINEWAKFAAFTLDFFPPPQSEPVLLRP